jgi:gas vesicle protein
MMADVKKIKNLVHEMVDKGVTTVEEIHKSIAQASRQGMEEVAPKEVKPLVEPAKEIHDTATGAVYDMIRMVNRKVSEISDEMLDKVGDASEKVVETYQEAVEPKKGEEAVS